MKRKQRSVVQFGNSLSVSLPCQWCVDHLIVKGSKRSIYINENMLFIRPVDNEQPQEDCINEESIQLADTPEQPQPSNNIDIEAMIRKHLG
jgi:hypothetical protein